MIAVCNNFHYLSTTEEIWASVEHKDFTRQFKNFLWKSLHLAHRIGPYWKHIPDCEERGTCQFCNETEDLDHITLKCWCPGQNIVWSLAKELWLRKHNPWPELSLGGLLGRGLASFSDEKGREMPGTSRLYCILISESMFIIWKIRNESVIRKQGTSLSANEIHNKWLYNINLHLSYDCLLTNHAKYGKQNAIKSALVLQTWCCKLKDEHELPDNWTKMPRVLVGIESCSSPPSPSCQGAGGDCSHFENLSFMVERKQGIHDQRQAGGKVVDRAKR
ncbi:hypothetical protein B0H10DRAFT_1794488 [Mycena sp. CBHHK59/15]|nr:hypothetical protein B0H10DRAFT_1794488 [Mycena sp. CBHHK59/15]